MSIHPLKDKPISITVNTTPNEHALKFSVNKKILESGYKTFNSIEEAKGFPGKFTFSKNDLFPKAPLSSDNVKFPIVGRYFSFISLYSFSSRFGIIVLTGVRLFYVN